MSRPPRAVDLRAVLRLDGAMRAFTVSTLGRLSYPTLSLALLLTVQDATGSYTVAGSCVGAYALASITMPLRSRLIDRRGRRRVLPALSLTFAASLLVMAGASVAGVGAPSVYLLLSTVIGLTPAPFGAVMRGLWAALAPEPEARRRVYGLDGAVEEVLWAVGPLLVALVASIADGAAALVMAAALNLVGGIGLAVTSVPIAPSAPVAPSPGRRLFGPLHQRSFRLLLVILFAVGVGAGPLEVAVAARTQEQGHPAALGFVLAALAAGSTIGGLAWGRVAHSGSVRVQLAALLGFTAVAGLAVAAAADLVILGVLLGVIGLAGAPVLIVAYLAADDLVTDDIRTESATWVTTAMSIGIAIGAAGAGVLIDSAGPGQALIAGAVAAGLTAALVIAFGRRLESR